MFSNNKMASEKVKTAKKAVPIKVKTAAKQKTMVDASQNEVTPVERSPTMSLVGANSKPLIIEKNIPIFATFSISSNVHLAEGLSVVRSLGSGRYEIVNIAGLSRAILSSEKAREELISADKDGFPRGDLFDIYDDEWNSAKEKCALASDIACVLPVLLHSDSELIF
jgi:hypothetical protein